ncbi:MAG: glutamyl-tRNA reductase [Myxococcales bacterium]|nr:glutamyl-tRNA reductase [Myxococcales bacterium]
MTLVLLGLNHRTAPVEVRERHAVTAAEQLALTEKLVASPEIGEAALLSTCNRTELLALSEHFDEAADRLLACLRHEIGDGTIAVDHVYLLRDRYVVEHLFRVASGLDSMVLGEAQILGQVKEAYRSSVAAGACGPILHRLFHRTFRSAKRVRSETGIGTSVTSVARVGVELAREIFEGFDEKRVALLGAGEMAESGLLGFRDAGAEHIVVLNRTVETAVSLAERHGGKGLAIDSLEEELGRTDILLTSLEVERPFLARSTLERVMPLRAGRPLLVIDLGIPRNVEASAGELSDLYLYNLDDLAGVARAGRVQRETQIPQAEKIVEVETERFEIWRESLPLVPAIRKLVERSESLAFEEVGRHMRRLRELTAAEGMPLERELERIARGIVAKVLHGPLQALRSSGSGGWAAYDAEAVNRIFGLDEENE